jgi:hypothetical protein
MRPRLLVRLATHLHRTICDRGMTDRQPGVDLFECFGPDPFHSQQVLDRTEGTIDLSIGNDSVRHCLTNSLQLDPFDPRRVVDVHTKELGKRRSMVPRKRLRSLEAEPAPLAAQEQDCHKQATCQKAMLAWLRERNCAVGRHWLMSRRGNWLLLRANILSCPVSHVGARASIREVILSPRSHHLSPGQQNRVTRVSRSSRDRVRRSAVGRFRHGARSDVYDRSPAGAELWRGCRKPELDCRGPVVCSPTRRTDHM